ncbi:hypothetical protein AGABI1DRAFT_113661 [Agaricus bisporus var. burnettii JB137-S8]|uniref:Mitochondrial import inner membrane translocase subunit TIM22 n=2 Tax=Agaricus bisporus TaxID=5341 RepID=K5W116_AGABU|nr:uncharacterized protein AGABI1DRAFT_113661 [Agaricus bisporus var. burnettii JB137-S8]EKM80494.1 hypothetical protein AGABI1DRAFT_113661 [Agaricus bisporus var. burnettii JB137-S8]
MERARTMSQDSSEQETKRVIRLDIPPRVFYVTGTAVAVGTVIGGVRGGRLAGMQFLAENVHRPPTTVQGWYFYRKTKNYKVMLGGLKGAGKDSLRLGLAVLGWVGTEEAANRFGYGNVKETGAGLVSAGAFSMIYRLPWKTTRRVLALGVVMGGVLDALEWGRREMGREL